MLRLLRDVAGEAFCLLPLPSLFKGGCRAERGRRVVKVGAARAGQSLSHFVKALFTQGSLLRHPEHGTKWSGGIPLQGKESGGDSLQARARARRRAPLPFGMTDEGWELTVSCPPCENPTKILRLFAGALFGRVPSEARREGCEGRCRACRTIPQSLRDSSLYTREPLMSSRTRNEVEWRDPLARERERGGFLTGKGARQTARALAVRNDG